MGFVSYTPSISYTKLPIPRTWKIFLNPQFWLLFGSNKGFEKISKTNRLFFWKIFAIIFTQKSKPYTGVTLLVKCNFFSVIFTQKLFGFYRIPYKVNSLENVYYTKPIQTYFQKNPHLF